MPGPIGTVPGEIHNANQGVVMQKRYQIEETVNQLFTPHKLMTIVFLIVLSVLLLGTSGIERRTMDCPIADNQQTVVSPILDTRG